MRAIVHIGAPKTGSSSIQALLGRNGAALASQGVRYARLHPRRGSQLEYAVAARTRAGATLRREHALRYGYPDMAAQERETAALLGQLREGRRRWAEPVFVVSSEHLLAWLQAPGEIDALDAMLGEVFDEVRYVLYLRRQEDLVVSSYSERIKRGATATLDAFLDARLRGLDHERVVRRWVERVGRARLDLRLLDADFLEDGDLLADFCAVCGGLDMTRLERPPRKNESLSAEAAEILRLFNEHTPDLRADGRRDPRGRWLRARLAEASARGSRIALSAAQRSRIRDAHAASNERLRRDYFPERAELFAPADTAPEPRDIAAIREDALRLASELLGQVAPASAPAKGRGRAGAARNGAHRDGAVAQFIRRARRGAGRLVRRARPGGRRLLRT